MSNKPEDKKLIVDKTGMGEMNQASRPRFLRFEKFDFEHWNKEIKLIELHMLTETTKD